MASNARGVAAHPLLLLMALLVVGSTLLWQGCYSFSGVSIDYNTVKTFSVSNFQVRAANAPPTTGIDFAEKLRDRVRQGTRLGAAGEAQPDVEFAGTISRYQLSYVAPQPGETVALQRLTIGVEVQFTHHKQKNADWSQEFSQFADFPASQDLSSVQDRLNTEIFDLIITDIFNRAFSNW